MSKDNTRTQSKALLRSWIIVISCGVLAIAGIVIVAILAQPARIANNFEECKTAGGVIMETYPEQCTINGQTFTNNAQSADGNSYVGMSEADALAKAKQDNTPARVVERDGEGLPVTMDFAFGRHNFYIKDGNVYKVEIEGQATDTQ